ncbi:MAG: hypothetical protein PVJ53_18150 [Desulfobacterales bacterium]
MTRPRIIVGMVFFFLCLATTVLSPSAYPQTPDADLWVSENLQAWGAESLAIDFGTHGLWNYNGSWIQLSRLNPIKMTSWGGSKLAVDFGRWGLWIYDGRAWEKITR